MNRELRIVSLLPSSTEIVCALGLDENLVGITHECDFPSAIGNRPALTSSKILHESMSSKEIDHSVRSQLDGHGSIYDLDEETLEELEPSLILTQELCDVCAVNYETVKKAAKIRVGDAKVVSLEPNTIGDIFDNIITIGELCGVRDRAEILVDSLSKRLESVKSNTNKLERKNAFMLEWLEPPFSPGHWVPEQVKIAGGISLLGKAGQRSITTTFDAISESNPEIMVFIPCGYYMNDIIEQLKNTYFPANWQEIDAIKNDNVWTLDATSYFSRPGPRVVEGAEILAKIFHREQFGVPSTAEAIKVPKNLLKFSDSKSMSA